MFDKHDFSHPFLDLLNQRVIIFDGAVGTNLQARDLTLDDYDGKEGCQEILVRTRPDVIRDLHASFLEVGVDVIETDTFGGTSVVLGEYDIGDDAYDLNLTAARLAKEVAADFSSSGEQRYVAGSMGPGTKLPSLGHISFADLSSAYRAQVAGLIDGGADLLIIETCQDLLQTKAAIIAIADEFSAKKVRIPVIAQVTMEQTGTMLLGSDMQTVITTLSPFPIDVLGMNCATGPKAMGAHVRTLSTAWDRPISIIPNAGLPQIIDGLVVYDLTAAELAGDLHHFVTDLGVNIVGGCCGTTPEHLKAVVDKLDGIVPADRDPQTEASASSLYGAAAYNINPKPLIIGERTNANGSKKFREHLLADDLDGMLEIAKTQVAEQAHLLDVCVAYVGRDEVDDLTRFTKRLNTDSTVPIMIDSTEPPAIEAALQTLAGKCLINSINLEDGEDRARQILGMCKRYGAGVVALTIDEAGMAKKVDQKLAIARRLYALAVDDFGLPPEDIFFDALTFTLGSGEEEFRSAAIDTIEAIREIKAEMPAVHTVLGVSNISFGLKPVIRHRLNSVFLHHAIEAGLDAAIVHAGKIVPLYKLPDEERSMLEDLVFDRRKEGYDPLHAVLAHYADVKAVKDDPADLAALPIDERLKKRIIDGNRVDLENDLDEALKDFAALDIVNTILLDGMKTVGELFGLGEMQLPFVLQSAETMKSSVAYLEPHMDKASSAASRGKMIIATVKGDVHDIGKNLVDIILTNNGYQMVNLGIKQPIDAIVAAYEESPSDAIGMSGLLVKSTLVMKENLEVLNERGLTPPVILGGAALTRSYVEDDLRSIYKGQVFYAKDAFEGLTLMNEINSGDVVVKAPKAPKKAKPQRPRLSKSRKAIEAVDPPEPPFWGSRVVTGIPLQAVTPFINKIALFRGQWGVKKSGSSPAAYEAMVKDTLEPTLKRLIGQAQREQLLHPSLVYGYFPCAAEGDALHVYAAPEDSEPLLTLEFPRQQEENGRCIADFFQPVGSDRKDVLGAHLVTVGATATHHTQGLFAGDNYAEYLYFHGFAVEVAEALAEYWHKEIRRELGIDGDDGAQPSDLFRQKYRGSRYSFGYPACPRLEDQAKLFQLLDPARINVSLTDEWQMVPEQSTSAIIVHHPDARYFSV